MRDQDRAALDQMTDVAAREHVSKMMSSLVSARRWTRERSMREWSRTEESVAATVQSADRRLLPAVRQAFLDYGFADNDASGASAHFLDSPLQRFERDVDVISGHVVFDYDTGR